MKSTFTTLFITLSVLAYGLHSDTSLVLFKGSKFYYIHSDSNANLLIFLHGGVENPIFKSTQSHSLEFLIEGNSNFIESAQKNKFDVLIPIKNDSLNWLVNPEYCFSIFKQFLDSVNQYTTYSISGFSDGGSGSYKIFYNNQSYFSALVCFNAFPQHKNFNKHVNYGEVSDKKVIFFSTFGDKVIPYEFSLLEYSKQKTYNANTYIKVIEGSHRFKDYKQPEMDLLFRILTFKSNDQLTEPIHAIIEQDQVIEFYPFRRKIVKKFGLGQEESVINAQQKR